MHWFIIKDKQIYLKIKSIPKTHIFSQPFSAFTTEWRQKNMNAFDIYHMFKKTFTDFSVQNYELLLSKITIEITETAQCS